MNESEVRSRLRCARNLTDKEAIQELSESLGIVLWLRAVHQILGRPFLRRLNKNHQVYVDLMPGGSGGSAPASPNGLHLLESGALDADQEEDDE